MANYTAPDDPPLGLSPDELLEHYAPGLRKVSPGFSGAWVRRRWLFREPALTAAPC